jgi:HEAT repeat protein
MECFFFTSLFAAKKAAKEVKKDVPVKVEPKLELVERIRLVLKFGNSSQIRESLTKVSTLKEADQKSLIPQVKELLNSKDVVVQKSVVQTVGEVKWNDLDDSIVNFLDSEDSTVVTTTASILRKKNILSAIPLLKEKLSKADYTVQDNHINDFINAFAGFKDSSLRDFMFDLLKKPEVLSIYKVFMLKYLSNLEGSTDDVKKYLLEVAGNEKEDLSLRTNAVRALGNMNYAEAREVFRANLEKIDSFTDLDKKREYFPFRLELISALVKLKDENVKMLLIQMTRDDDELVRLRAIRRLADFKSNEFIDLLEYKEKYDSSTAVQKEAKKALDIIRGKKESSDDGL